jgi:probable HAF family extracellular repeat protein
MPAFTELSFDGLDLLARGINNHGEIVGTYTPFDGGFEQGFVSRSGTTTTFNPTDAQYALSLSLSNSGNMTGWGSTNSGLFAYSYSHGEMQSFSVPGAGTTLPTGMNDRRDIVGAYTTGDPEHTVIHGFIYSHGQFTTLDAPNADSTTPIGVNNAGQVVGSYFSGGQEHGFVYDHGKFTSIDVPGQSNTVATAINSRGDIVGYYQDENARYHGFLDHNGAFTTIDEPNADYATLPEDISDTGAIVGIYVNTETGTHGFMLA